MPGGTTADVSPTLVSQIAVASERSSAAHQMILISDLSPTSIRRVAPLRL